MTVRDSPLRMVRIHYITILMLHGTDGYPALVIMLSPRTLDSRYRLMRASRSHSLDSFVDNLRGTVLQILVEISAAGLSVYLWVLSLLSCSRGRQDSSSYGIGHQIGGPRFDSRCYQGPVESMRCTCSYTTLYLSPSETN